jgi:hypothetical protein
MTEKPTLEREQSTKEKTTVVNRHAARRSRIAAVGVGAAVMAGLVSQMEISANSAQATATPVPPAGPAKRAAADALSAARAKATAAATAASRPIVLTPHAVVNTVAGPATTSSSASSGSGYVAPAAPAAAPAATTGGSQP